MQCKISKWKKDSRRWILEMNSTDSYIFLKVSDYIVGLILGYKSCSFTTLITGSSRCVCTKPSCLWADSNWGVGAIAAATGTDLLAPRASPPPGHPTPRERTTKVIQSMFTNHTYPLHIQHVLFEWIIKSELTAYYSINIAQ